jgi:hypothetical protein
MTFIPHPLVPPCGSALSVYRIRLFKRAAGDCGVCCSNKGGANCRLAVGDDGYVAAWLAGTVGHYNQVRLIVLVPRWAWATTTRHAVAVAVRRPLGDVTSHLEFSLLFRRCTMQRARR